jgi:hypothetical protein
MGWPHHWLPSSSTEYSRPKAASEWFQSGGGDGLELPPGIGASEDCWASEFAEPGSDSISTHHRQHDMHHTLQIQRQQMLQVDPLE